MLRRDFLRRAALVATGLVAADQLELLERLTHTRRFWPGWSPELTHFPASWKATEPVWTASRNESVILNGQQFMIGEGLLYDRVLPPGERYDVRAYLTKKWGASPIIEMADPPTGNTRFMALWPKQQPLR